MKLIIKTIVESPALLTALTFVVVVLLVWAWQITCTVLSYIENWGKNNDPE